MLRRIFPRLSAGTQNLRPAQVEYLNKFREKIQNEEGPEPDLFPPAVSKVERGKEALPPWLKLKIPKGNTYPTFLKLKKQMREQKLATVCEEARCPNIGECWGGEDGENATATIMLMGDECTRGCRFCSVKTKRQPKPLDPEEPKRVGIALAGTGLDYVVLTMVDRDDVADGGATHVAACIQEIKKSSPNLMVEVLVGDFRGNTDCCDVVAKSGLEVYAHNIECVERITPRVRDRRATYRQTLKVLQHVKSTHTNLYTKSSIMLGLGEEETEIRQTMRDLRDAGVDFLTLGQYLQPDRSRMKVERYAHPDEFEMWRREGEGMGFRYVASGPMVRSSYRAGEYFIRNAVKNDRATKKV